MIETLPNVLSIGNNVVSKILPPFFTENIDKFVGNFEFRRIFIIIAVAIVYIICIVLYELGKNNPYGSRPENYAEILAPKMLAFAPYLFSEWFVIGGLTLSLVGFILVMLFLKEIHLSFVITAGVYLVSFPLLFAKFYFNFAFPTSALNVFGFNIILNSFFTLLNLLSNAKSNLLIFLGVLCLIPSFAFAGLLMYCGRFVSS